MELLTKLEERFAQARDPKKAEPMAAYMRNKFPFVGIKKPERAHLQKDIFKNYLPTTEHELTEILLALFHKQEREYQYAALDLAYASRKLWTPRSLETFEFLIRTKSWWDTVDILAPKMLGTLLIRYPELASIMNTWIHDENIWIKRTALIYQLSYKEVTDQNRLFEYCLITMHEKEFFIRKAIGWALRTYARAEPTAVREFITKNKEFLSGLSYREAGKYCLTD